MTQPTLCYCAPIYIEHGIICDSSIRQSEVPPAMSKLLRMFWSTPTKWVISTITPASIRSESHANACSLVLHGLYSPCSLGSYSKARTDIYYERAAALPDWFLQVNASNTATHGSLRTNAHRVLLV